MPTEADPPYKVGDTLAVRFATNAICIVDFISAMLCFVDPQVHVAGSVGACYSFGDGATHRNDGEIDFTIGAALAGGTGFYRVRIADNDDANMHTFSDLIEIIGIVAEGASVSPTPAAAEVSASQEDGSLIIVLSIVGAALVAFVVVAVLVTTAVTIICTLKKKNAVGGSASEPIAEVAIVANPVAVKRSVEMTASV